MTKKEDSEMRERVECKCGIAKEDCSYHQTPTPFGLRIEPMAVLTEGRVQWLDTYFYIELPIRRKGTE